MADTIKIEVNDVAIQKIFRQMVERGEDLSPATKIITGIMADQAEEAFDSESDPETGAVWEELAKPTIKKREKDGHWPGKILQVTGSLAASVQAR